MKELFNQVKEIIENDYGIHTFEFEDNPDCLGIRWNGEKVDEMTTFVFVYDSIGAAFSIKTEYPFKVPENRQNEIIRFITRFNNHRNFEWLSFNFEDKKLRHNASTMYGKKFDYENVRGNFYSFLRLGPDQLERISDYINPIISGEATGDEQYRKFLEEKLM